MSNPVSERTKQRRRILRAAAGGPIVLTLPSGAAFAATSLSCQVKSAVMAFDESTAGAVTSADKWVRFEVAAYRINQSGGPVDGFKLLFDGNDDWYRVHDNGTVSSVTPNGNPSATGGYFYLLVDYDAYISNGSDPRMFVYRGDPIANPIAGTSCWNSISSTADELSSNVIRG